MGEASGEVVAPPQAIEVKEANSNFGLSVNGSQLIALANLNYLEEHGFANPMKPNLIDRFKTLKNLPHHKRLLAIKKLILDGKLQEARGFLEQGIILRNPFNKSENLVRETSDSLSKDISVKDAFKNYREHDASFREFIRSLPGKPLNELPEKNTRIFLPQLGVMAFINPKINKLRLSPTYYLRGMADLPADRQYPLYIEEGEIFGEESNEITLSRLELFAELAKRYPKVFTHSARWDKVPTILSSGHLGVDYGYIASRKELLYAETLTFRDKLEYAKAIQDLKSGKTIAIPWDRLNLPRDVKSGSHHYPLHELTYINPKDTHPVAIFSDQLPQEHKMDGWIIDGVIDLKEKCIVGIWVPPNYKRHLLHWISTWTEEKRQQVFGERKPESVLISSAKDLPSLEK